MYHIEIVYTLHFKTAELNILDPSSYIEPWEDESIMICIHYSKGNWKPYKVILKGNRNGAEWNVYVPSHLRTPSHLLMSHLQMGRRQMERSHLQTGRRQMGRSRLATFCPICRRDVSRWDVPSANILPDLPTFWPICQHHLKAALLTNAFCSVILWIVLCDPASCITWSCQFRVDI